MVLYSGHRSKPRWERWERWERYSAASENERTRQRQLMVEYRADNRHYNVTLLDQEHATGGAGARRCEGRAVIGASSLSRSRTRDTTPGRAEEAAVRNAGSAQQRLRI